MQAYSTLLQSYQELNGSHISELRAEPSALEFARFAGRNRPFVARGAARRWPAVQRWNRAYLMHTMGERLVRIAVTPLGNADAPVERPQNDHNNANGDRYVFVQPSEELQAFAEFLPSLATAADGPVCYAQSQNDNLRNEYLPLFPDILPSIDWASSALQQPSPDAMNVWFGSERSTTALHKDNYENIYVQIVGRKHFVLLPPIEGPCVNEVSMPQGVYQRESDEQGVEHWTIKELPDAGRIPVAIWDPDLPERRAIRYSHLSRPLRVTLEPGDMLYLPSTWYHKVTQTCGSEGFCAAVNYWYDMDFEGSFHPTTTFVREVMAEIDQASPV